ncbi:MAG: TusE/DsrC/DsvC family sulfur relay protein [Xanthobacteraceae bacterium]|nr:TusE/DsrC/DsvC family sulfur relay protein [Xanthobacteraceae bacterium]
MTDAEGYLVDPSEWTEALAEKVARTEGIALTDEHWRVIRFIRRWLEEHGVTPDAFAMSEVPGRRPGSWTGAHVRAPFLRLRETGLQDCRNEEAARVEHRIGEQARAVRARLRTPRYVLLRLTW